MTIQNRDGLVAALARLGELDRDIQAIETETSEKVARLTAAGATLTQPKADARTALADEIEAYARAHREALVGEKASVTLPSGTIAWRKGQPKLIVEAGKADDVLEDLATRADADRFVRTRREMIQKALLDAPDVVEAVEGLSIRKAEETFKATPAKAAPLSAPAKAA